MNKLICLAVLFFAMVSCSKEQGLTVSVKNPTALDRKLETVEVNWKQLTEKLQGVNQNNVVVYDAAGQEIPSQVIFEGGKEPVAFIFQVSVQPNAEAVFTIKLGQPASYTKQAYGRFVPERMDDYAWENNLVGHRMYGPALEATGEISNGIDTWVKRTNELLIDEWYKTGNYHKDHGKGMDCYKVGRTLGSGAMAPYIDGKIVLANNYIKQQTLDNGPIRISFRLEYAPFQVGQAKVTETRTISLDANSHFIRIEEVYAGSPEDMAVVAGIVTRPEPGDTLMDASNGVVAYWEPQNNDNGDNNGHIGIGLIFPGNMTSVFAEQGHLLALTTYPRAGKPFVYYMGTGWSKAGIESAQAWFDMVNNENAKVKNPLVVKILDK